MARLKGLPCTVFAAQNLLLCDFGAFGGLARVVATFPQSVRDLVPARVERAARRRPSQRERAAGAFTRAYLHTMRATLANAPHRLPRAHESCIDKHKRFYETT
jgi:hypothetical protein